MSMVTRKVEVEFRSQLRQNADNRMPQQDRGLSPELLVFAPMARTALGVAGGVVLGGMIFLMTTILLLRGGYPLGPNLGLLRQYFYGYSVTWVGSLVGLAWGFGVGFVLGWGFALVRNLAIWVWLTVTLSRAEMDQYGDFLDHM